MDNNILIIDNLSKFYKINSYLNKYETVNALTSVSLVLNEGVRMGLVGESGCGKTTLAKCILGLEQPTSGSIYYKNKLLINSNNKFPNNLRSKIQIVFQDPYDSLNPRLSVVKTLLEPLNLHTKYSKSKKISVLNEMMDIVGLLPVHLNRYPHQLSTGQQQRVGIARAIITNPDIVILDEPTSALDLSIKGRVLELLLNIQQKYKITYLFISHDLSTVKYFCTNISVMYLGKIVESGPTLEVFNNPKHPYTQGLINSIPSIGVMRKNNKQLIEGEIPSPINPPSGCNFHTRCPIAKKVCKDNIPKLIKINNSRNVACHFV